MTKRKKETPRKRGKSQRKINYIYNFMYDILIVIVICLLVLNKYMLVMYLVKSIVYMLIG